MFDLVCDEINVGFLSIRFQFTLLLLVLQQKPDDVTSCVSVQTGEEGSLRLQRALQRVSVHQTGETHLSSAL